MSNRKARTEKMQRARGSLPRSTMLKGPPASITAPAHPTLSEKALLNGGGIVFPRRYIQGLAPINVTSFGNRVFAAIISSFHPEMKSSQI